MKNYFDALTIAKRFEESQRWVMEAVCHFKLGEIEIFEEIVYSNLLQNINGFNFIGNYMSQLMQNKL